MITHMNNDTNTGSKAWLYIIITALFCFWGLANNLTGVLQKAFGQILDIDSWQTVLIQSAFYAAYFCFALPATYYIFRNSYKGATLIGLLMYAMGATLFFPASSVGSVYFYILAIYIMAGGCAVLETVANPYVLSLEKDFDRGIRRLNIVQSFNPLGSIVGILLGNTIVISHLSGSSNPEVLHEELDTITLLYAVLGEVLLIFMVTLLFISMPVPSTLKEEGSRKFPRILEGLGRLRGQRRFRSGVLVLMLYTTAQTGVWGYATQVVEGVEDSFSADGNTVYMLAIISFAAFRFLFSALMGSYNWAKLLFAAAVMAAVMSLVVVFGSGATAITALIMVSGMMSLMFPTIFGSALQFTGKDMQIGASLLIMSISGSLVLAPVQNIIAQSLGPQLSYIVPVVCFMAIAIYAAGLLLHDRKK